MPMTALGVTKLIEECGELQQVLGKRLAYWATNEHPDGSDLHQRMIDEMGDVLGALNFVSEKFGITIPVNERARRKFYLFHEWDADPDNNADGIDRVAGRGVSDV